MNFTVELIAEMGEEILVMNAWSVARKNNLRDAKTFGGAKNGTDIVGGADVV